MSWINNPRIDTLMKKATDVLLKGVLQKVHNENNRNDCAETLDECLDEFCKKGPNPSVEHTSTSVLSLAKLFYHLGDNRVSCELIWCVVSLAISEFIQERELNVKLVSHQGKRRFLRKLSDHIVAEFPIFEICHNSFYTNDLERADVAEALKLAPSFIELLRSFELTDTKKAELERNPDY
ncbi:unnamed protein product [Auanema sp. JU1783]|nr:unnamed protein product [Auanema sp. JU1783]